MTSGWCHLETWYTSDEKTTIQHDFLTKYLVSSFSPCDKPKRHKHSPGLALGKGKRKQTHAQSWGFAKLRATGTGQRAASSMSEGILNLNFPRQARAFHRRE